MIRKEGFGSCDEIGLTLVAAGNLLDTLHRAFHRAHGAGVETHTFGAERGVDHPDILFVIRIDGAGGTGILTGTAIDTIVCNSQAHGGFICGNGENVNRRVEKPGAAELYPFVF